MKFYIALGGIACRALKEYSKSNPDDTFYYIDSDLSTIDFLDPADSFYCIPAVRDGTGAFRQIGKNAIKHEIYSGKLTPFFEALHRASFADITMFTSSFGGFGSAAATELLDFLECILFEKPNQNQGKHCRIIAFSESLIYHMRLSMSLLETYRLNTLEMLSDIAAKQAKNPAMHFVPINGRLFNPECRFFLVDAESYDMRSISSFLGMDDTRLQQLDVQHRYVMKAPKSAPPVFISYSSKDQSIADLLVSSLEKQNISCWIATKSIHEGSYAAQIVQGIRNAKIFIVLLSKNAIASEQVKNEIDRAFSRLTSGLKIVPFVIDDAELDDECAYYLCRQEFYFGNVPPIVDRIRELADKVSDMLE